MIAAGQSLAAEIILDIRNADQAGGRVYVMLCGKRDFRGDDAITKWRAASGGRTVVSSAGIRPGHYAFSAL